MVVRLRGGAASARHLAVARDELTRERRRLKEHAWKAIRRSRSRSETSRSALIQRFCRSKLFVDVTPSSSEFRASFRPTLHSFSASLLPVRGEIFSTHRECLMSAALADTSTARTMNAGHGDLHRNGGTVEIRRRKAIFKRAPPECPSSHEGRSKTLAHREHLDRAPRRRRRRL